MSASEQDFRGVLSNSCRSSFNPASRFRNMSSVSPTLLGNQRHSRKFPFACWPHRVSLVLLHVTASAVNCRLAAARARVALISLYVIKPECELREKKPALNETQVWWWSWIIIDYHTLTAPRLQLHDMVSLKRVYVWKFRRGGVQTQIHSFS